MSEEKVEYWVQWFNGRVWCKYDSYESVKEAYRKKTLCKKRHERYKHRILKRTTIEEVVE